MAISPAIPSPRACSIYPLAQVKYGPTLLCVVASKEHGQFSHPHDHQGQISFLPYMVRKEGGEEGTSPSTSLLPIRKEAGAKASSSTLMPSGQAQLQSPFPGTVLLCCPVRCRACSPECCRVRGQASCFALRTSGPSLLSAIGGTGER